ncbi:GNAT family N-acetyltransferase [Lusitaniella coriacea LEGE 07157]|uniref:GNAT family N-acetyltransferase n=1 Tax=Lusitaniella coriacea LEGE 07157 TaxID=945747 RepID=A0A8J7B0D3_9CYAN|nr:GNAT family N-acetyltransferase [Lusitaniella coriacea]MBE9114810.1 GNAT family N-acetyltransferase [Lusitaniella coriacea LEGE 07157]
MNLQPPFRPAHIEDCRKIAELFTIASDGVSNYVWSTMSADYPGLTLLEIGAQRYANPDGNFSYKNCVVAEKEGEVVGLLVTFPIPESEGDSATEEVEEASEEPDVLAPYNLEAPGTWYVCAIALFPEFCGQGLGTQFIDIALQQAKEQEFKEVSLLCFEQNTGAFKLYQRNNFKIIDRVKVVPHEFIHHTGDLLLMTAPV